ncbi:hypothetical protein Pla163_03170 [Planctomycetes bacterium Pla163]|uniref:Carbohydrate-binding module family 96 domain-containing protein n=1 Tax=Rohdeia mirabilis TaxID=2528008 RepID=A0A518CVG9_9BACT|nr:hypothetical protein Pla163_03170 [Planctomycetes bacterium Pla163]
MRPSTLSLLLAVAAVHCAPSAPGQSSPTGDQIFVDQSFSFTAPSFGSLPNGAAHAHDTIVSHAGWQYVAYWDAQRRLAVARRDLGGAVDAGAWQILAFDDYAIPGEDAHNTVNVGICPGDGTLHLAFDHHGDDLNYRRSVPGLATDPVNADWSATGFGPILDALDPSLGTMTKVTYPRFVPTPTGDLHLVYREFSSGDGRARMADYDSATGTWSNDRVFIERTGPHSDPLGGASSSRNPYFNRIDYDDRGTLHATWTWREKAPIRYNRDICYAYSEDGGVRWFNGAHQLVADTGLGQVIDAATPGIVGVELGAEWGLMNDQGHVVDARGNVHVVMYHKDTPATVVSYGSVWNSHYRHYWLAADGEWRTSALTTMGNRPKLFTGPNGTLVLAYVAAGDMRVDVASEGADFLDWSTAYSGATVYGSSFQGDLVRFVRESVLDGFFQERVLTLGDTSPLYVESVDLSGVLAARPSDEPVVSRTRIETERDTWVAEGSSVLTAAPDATTLSVRASGGGLGTQLAFVRFHLAELQGRGALERVVLRLALADVGAEFGAADLGVTRCAQDVWAETGLAWDDRPLPVGPTFSGRRIVRGTAGLVEIDVTEAIAAELANGGERITFELSGLVRGPGEHVHLAAREHPTLPAAVLVADQNTALAPVADTYVRSGVHALTSYGDEPRLIVKSDGNADFDRVAYLKFEVGALRGTGAIERVFLEAHSPVGGSLARTTPYAAHAVQDDGWNEATATWASAPALGERLDAHFGRDALRWDVTAAVLDALDGDGTVSIGLQSEREESTRILHLYSRESGDPDRAPRLVVRYAAR